MSAVVAAAIDIGARQTDVLVLTGGVYCHIMEAGVFPELMSAIGFEA